MFIFAATVGILLLRDRKNIKFHYGIIIRRWTEGVHLIDKLVSKYPKLITTLGNFGVGMGFIAGIGGVILLLVLTASLQQSFALVLPTAGGYKIPGPVISVPFWYWLIAIFIIAATHETMHAIFVRLEKVPLKNYGILMLLFLPIGAFVDPDDKKIRRLSPAKKLRIFAAGSFANFVTAILAIGLFISGVYLFASTTKTSGVIIDSIDENSPASEANLEGVIVKVNDEKVSNVVDFVNALNNSHPGDGVTFTTDKGVYNINLAENPEDNNKTYIGVKIRNMYEYNALGIGGQVPSPVIYAFFAVMSFLNWLFLISLGVGIVNMLPMKPLDGGLFFGEILTRMFPNKGAMMMNILSILMAGIIVFNLFGIQLIKAL